MLKKILSALVVIASFSGCIKGDSGSSTTCNYDACSYKAPASEIQAVKDYLAANNITATEHCSGVYYKIDEPGTGKSVTACGGIKATYEGKLTNGNTFDQGSFPDYIALGNLIRGWINVIPLIKEGGKVHLYIPPTMGYGANDVKDQQGNVKIPANSVLIFELTLTSVY